MPFLIRLMNISQSMSCSRLKSVMVTLAIILIKQKSRGSWGVMIGFI